MCDCCLIKENRRLTEELKMKKTLEQEKKKKIEELFNPDFFDVDLE